MQYDAEPKVLVIDDDPIQAETLAMILNISGFRATAVTNGEHGVKLARSEAFDYLVTDVMMPGMNGIEAAIVIREMQPNCRILLISGNGTTSELLAAAAAQGYSFEIFAKPIHPTVLLDRLRAQSSLMRPVAAPPAQPPEPLPAADPQLLD